MHRTGLFLSLILLISACKKTEQDHGNYSAGYEYFPVNIGHELIYDIDSIVYNDFNNSVDTFTSQRKELIADTFTGLNGKLNQRIEWYYRLHDTDEWVLTHVGTSVLKSNMAEVTENNERLIRLVFPVSASKSWNAYAYTTRLDEPAFYYDDINASYQGTNELFLNTIKVVEQSDSNLIELRENHRIYAPFIGVVYQQNDSLDTQFDIGGQPKTKGLRYRLKLRTYIK